MIINHDKHYKLYVAIYSFAFIGILFLYVYGFGLSIWVAVLINSPAILIAILGLISYGRTFILSEEGCTICFWNYRKKYSWDELKTKRIERYYIPDIFGGTVSCPYTEVAVIAPYVIHKPKFIRASLYSCLHPLSCIYINFALSKGNYETGRYYEIDKEIFQQRMNEWNIIWECT